MADALDHRRRALGNRAPERNARGRSRRRSRRGCAERPRRPGRHRHGRDRGRADGLRDPGRGAGLQRRPRRRRSSPAGRSRLPRRRSTGSVARRSRRRSTRSAAIQAGHLERRCRRRHRIDVARADGLEPRRRRLVGPQSEDRRALADRAAGHLGRGDREGVGRLARAARRLLARVDDARDRGDRRRQVRAGDRAGHAPGRRNLLRRRGSAPRHVGKRLADLKPAFIEDGRVTAGNSSQIVEEPPPCSSSARPPPAGSA